MLFELKDLESPYDIGSIKEISTDPNDLVENILEMFDQISKLVSEGKEIRLRYSNNAYINEIMKNLSIGSDLKKNLKNGKDLELFQFKEIEIRLDKALEEEIVPLKSSFVFLAQIEEFYMQGRTNSDNPVHFKEFIKYLFEYDKKIIHESMGKTVWIENDIENIKCIKLALIAKTYMDLDQKEKYLMDVKKDENHWKSEHTFRATLKNTTPDIVMRYFFIAYQSEMMNYNEKYGYGSYPIIFKPIYLEKYKLVQTIMSYAFRIDNPSDRSIFLKQVLIEICKIGGCRTK